MFDPDKALLVGTLSACTTLVSLTLVESDLRQWGKPLGKILSNLQRLQVVAFDACNLQDSDVRWIVRGLCKIEKLKEVSIVRSGAAALSCKAFSKAFCNPWVTWCVLRFTDNMMRTYPACLLCASLVRNDTLTVVDLSWTGVGNEALLDALVRALRKNSVIQELALQYCHISDRGSVLISSLLRTTTTLVSLDLTGNPIGTFGCRSILRTLGLKQTGTPSVGALTIKMPFNDGRPIAKSSFDWMTFEGEIRMTLSNAVDRALLEDVALRVQSKKLIITDDQLRFPNGTTSLRGAVARLAAAKQRSYENLDADVERMWNSSVDDDPTTITAGRGGDSLPLAFVGATGSGGDGDSQSDGSELAAIQARLVRDPFEFSFQAILAKCPPEERDVATDYEIEVVLAACNALDSGSELRSNYVQMIMGGESALTIPQVLWMPSPPLMLQIIKLIGVLRESDRPQAVEAALGHCIEKKARSQILDTLSKHDSTRITNLINRSLLEFTPNNPTGHYRLTLSVEAEHMVALKLIEVPMCVTATANSVQLRNECRMWLAENVRWQSCRYKLERCILNAKCARIPRLRSS